MKGILPEPIRARWRKQGFVPPQAVWLSRGLLQAVKDAIHDSSFAHSDFWEPEWWRNAVRRFEAGETALASALWKLLATEAWLAHFVRPAAAQVKFAPTA